jgi:hypothetical protein
MRTALRILPFCILGLSIGTPPDAMAWRGFRARRADRNNDGVVTPVEVRREHQVEMHQRSQVNTRWEARADADHDGRVEPAEAQVYKLNVMDANHDGVVDAAERKVYWAGWQCAVTTETEKKYDADANGFLTWNEARELLRARALAASIEGRAVVDTDIEKEFDGNGDGVIDKVEAERMREAAED